MTLALLRESVNTPEWRIQGKASIAGTCSRKLLKILTAALFSHVTYWSYWTSDGRKSAPSQSTVQPVTQGIL
jgi:hypothetical protein